MIKVWVCQTVLFIPFAFFSISEANLKLDDFKKKNSFTNNHNGKVNTLFCLREFKTGKIK